MAGFLKGLLIGFTVAAPLGPIGIICLRRAITHGRLAGFVSGLGAATADAAYALIAALGLTAITNLLVEHKAWLQGGGGVFLVYLGVTMLRSRPAQPETVAVDRGLVAGYASTFALTFTNPMTILSFVGLFAGFGLESFASGMVVAGVFLGSALWWLLLSAVAGWFSGRAKSGSRRTVNVIAGLIVAGLGVWQLVQLCSSGLRDI
jgi:threonine/homoserine/homoserine lactone efflux protein